MGTEASIYNVGDAGPPGPPGPAGGPGPAIELQTSPTHVQWRVVGDTTWIDLVAISSLVGPAGPAGPMGNTGQTGPAGEQVQLQTSATHIQWKYSDAATWTDLVPLESLQGPQGEATSILTGVYPPDDGLGEDGDFIIVPDHPDDGAVIYGPKDLGVWDNQSYIVIEGPPGLASERVVLNGAGAPGGSVGSINDFYIDIAVWDLYGPKTSGGWGTPVSMIGPPAELPLNNWEAVTDPTATDDSSEGYERGSIWSNIDVGNEKVFLCIDDTAGTAIWTQIG